MYKQTWHVAPDEANHYLVAVYKHAAPHGTKTSETSMLMTRSWSTPN
ncbi:MAG TPA: hypothetical protein VFD48_00745 [Pyrinomonadaceae bacterium]|nr:hypothetical protein [Pyrinomonadaceae bacterium]